MSLTHYVNVPCENIPFSEPFITHWITLSLSQWERKLEAEESFALFLMGG